MAITSVESTQKTFMENGAFVRGFFVDSGRKIRPIFHYVENIISVDLVHLRRSPKKYVIYHGKWVGLSDPTFTTYNH